MNQNTVTAAWLATSGAAFVAYPALRPWGSEAGMEGAATFGSILWPVSHVLGMVGFVALAFALRSAATLSLPEWSRHPARRTEGTMWLAVALLLPYYGAEAWGLHALGEYAAEHGETGVLDVADAFRLAPLPMTTFAVGLLLLILVGARLAHGLWHSHPVARAGGLLTGLGLATYLPQFFGGAGLRITHGLVLGAGLVLLAVATVRRGAETDAGHTSMTRLAS